MGVWSTALGGDSLHFLCPGENFLGPAPLHPSWSKVNLRFGLLLSEITRKRASLVVPKPPRQTLFPWQTLVVDLPLSATRMQPGRAVDTQAHAPTYSKHKISPNQDV